MTQLSNTLTRYGTVAKAFHWSVMLLIFALIPLGILASRNAHGAEPNLDRAALLFSLHKTLGVTLFALAILRIGWALSQTKPGPLHPERRAETFLAGLVHWLLYACLILVPITGWVSHAATEGFAPIWWPFGQNLPFVPESDRVREVSAGLHIVFERVLVLSLLLHIAGALKHHVVDKDNTLRRMWFGQTEAPGVPPHKGTLAPPITALGVFAAALGIGAYLGVYGHAEAGPESAQLEAVSSDWAVTDGTLEIGIKQSGNDVSGRFANWTADISFDPQVADPKGAVTVTVDIASLTLGSVTSDAMTPPYFNVAAFPTATFTADIFDAAVFAEGEGPYEARGTLTIKGTDVPLTLPFALTLDGDTATMTGLAEVNRRDFDIGADIGDSSLAPEVSISVTLTATRATEEAPQE